VFAEVWTGVKVAASNEEREWIAWRTADTAYQLGLEG